MSHNVTPSDIRRCFANPEMSYDDVRWLIKPLEASERQALANIFDLTILPPYSQPTDLEQLVLNSLHQKLIKKEEKTIFSRIAIFFKGPWFKILRIALKEFKGSAELATMITDYDKVYPLIPKLELYPPLTSPSPRPAPQPAPQVVLQNDEEDSSPERLNSLSIATTPGLGHRDKITPVVTTQQPYRPAPSNARQKLKDNLGFQSPKPAPIEKMQRAQKPSTPAPKQESPGHNTIFEFEME